MTALIDHEAEAANDCLDSLVDYLRWLNTADLPEETTEGEAYRLYLASRGDIEEKVVNARGVTVGYIRWGLNQFGGLWLAWGGRGSSDGCVHVPDFTPEQVARNVERHRQRILETAAAYA